MKFLFALVLLSVSLEEGTALECFDCVSIDVPTDPAKYPRHVYNYFVGSTDYEAKCYLPNMFTSHYRTCPDDDGYVCAHLGGTMLGKLVNFTEHGEEVKFNLSVTVRRCMHVSNPCTRSGCSHDKELVMNEVFQKTVAGFDRNKTVIQHMTGSVCYCTTSWCDPGCGDDAYIIDGKNCIPKWTIPAVLGTIFGSLLVSIASCCCCCKCCRICCCCCCRKRMKKPSKNGRKPVGKMTSRRPSDCQPLVDPSPPRPRPVSDCQTAPPRPRPVSDCQTAPPGPAPVSDCQPAPPRPPPVSDCQTAPPHAPPATGKPDPRRPRVSIQFVNESSST